MSPTPTLYLASQSPRRRELLAQLGLHPITLSVAVDETPHLDESATAYVVRLALAKAAAGVVALPPDAASDAVVLGADTSVVVDDAILGKPQDREHGLTMLTQLSGRNHRVLSAVALDNGHRQAWRLSDSQVSFVALTTEQQAAYWASTEPLDKAGAYAIQGLGALFVTNLQGSYSGVMGLPLFETGELLQDFAIQVLSAASSSP